ncbi:protein NUCLEAR FUSION DEFECTIVE 4 [Rhododendron vialii]|uniref:protein NUCLEAR FUSION DEFECTIVE 4 n=1 Tax=Rhododendron vialii TaxID=182163 RepID=UPI00265ED8B3|nr:protein NUCLEAR FUSION DEFECTIVE 4 [Rhododendron vialii]
MSALKAGSRPPWVGLGAAVWVQIATGNVYTFPLYSAALKTVMGYNQHQLTILGVANDIGENIGIPAGIACNKFPPWIVLSIGVCVCFLGYGVLWLAVSQTVQSMPFWLLFIALCVATNGSSWLGTAVLVTNMKNFPLSRGTVAGILKGYIGLSAAVYTEVYTMVLGESASKLLLFLTLGIPFICLAMMYFIRPCTPASGEDSSEHVHFLFTQAASVALAIYLLTTTILKDILSISDTISYVLIAIMIILLMSPIAIPIKMTLFPANPKKPMPLIGSSNDLGAEEGDSSQTGSLLVPSSSEPYLGSFYESEDVSEVDILLAVGEGAVKKKRKPKRGEDFTFREAVVKADFWLLWLVYFLGVGSGVTVLNNLAQIGVALGVDDTTVLLSIFSFCNFLGRLGAGAVSEHFVRSKTIPRTVWMAFAQIIMIVAFLLYASAISGTLYAATALLGICYGVQIAIMIPVASELFGLKHFGVIFNFMGLGNPLAALLFSGLLAGYVYDIEEAKQGGSSCLGPNCFRLTFYVLASMCGLGSILSIILTIRIKPVYQMLYAGGSFRISQSSDH